MDDLEVLEREIKKCTKCKLYKTKTNYVPGEGNPKAKIVFVGEAPGKEEDRQGRPFVGNAGKLLTEMLEKIGLKRDDVFICNVLKCRPPNNRDPEPDEIKACGEYLVRQLNVIKPDVIVCLGRFAASFIFNLFNIDFPSISKVRSKIFEVEKWGKKIKIIAIYHPAAVLYRPQLREEYEKDFEVIGKLVTKKQSTLFDYL